MVSSSGSTQCRESRPPTRPAIIPPSRASRPSALTFVQPVTIQHTQSKLHTVLLIQRTNGSKAVHSNGAPSTLQPFNASTPFYPTPRLSHHGGIQSRRRIEYHLHQLRRRF